MKCKHSWIERYYKYKIINKLASIDVINPYVEWRRRYYQETQVKASWHVDPKQTHNKKQ